jgi:hypothetical protein
LLVRACLRESDAAVHAYSQTSYAFALAKVAALVGVVSPAPLLAVVYAVEGGAVTEDDPNALCGVVAESAAVCMPILVLPLPLLDVEDTPVASADVGVLV